MNSVWKDGRALAAHGGLATQQQPWPPPEDTATWLPAVKKQACTHMYILVSNYQEKKKKQLSWNLGVFQIPSHRASLPRADLSCRSEDSAPSSPPQTPGSPPQLLPTAWGAGQPHPPEGSGHARSRPRLRFPPDNSCHSRNKPSLPLVHLQPADIPEHCSTQK